MSHWLLSLAPIVGIAGVFGGGASQIPNSKFVARLIAGLCFGYLLSLVNVWLWLYTAVFIAASAPGVGQPEGFVQIRKKWGAKKAWEWYAPGEKYGGLEWWQLEELRYRPYWSLAVRGAFYINPLAIIANPLAMWLAISLPETKLMNWGRWHEFLFPALLYLFTLSTLSFVI